MERRGQAGICGAGVLLLLGLRKWLKPPELYSPEVKHSVGSWAGHPLEKALEHSEGREIQTITRRSCLGFQEDVVISKYKWIYAAALWVGCVWGICLKPSNYPDGVDSSVQQAEG